MSPTAKELAIIAGDEVRFDPDYLGKEANSREKFFVFEAPAPGMFGVFVAGGKLTGREITFGPEDDILAEKIDT